MTRELKIVSVGDSLGIILPEEILQRLGVESGDTLSISEVPGGYSSQLSTTSTPR